MFIDNAMIIVGAIALVVAGFGILCAHAYCSVEGE